MTYAYDKLYLDRARRTMGNMFDVAVYRLGYELPVFFEKFVTTNMAEGFQRGVPDLLVGRSGAELVIEVLERSGESGVHLDGQPSMNRSPEYWTGWALCYYQWLTGKSFADIVAHVPLDTILSLYGPYHEMDIRQFADKMDELYGEQPTRLKQLRTQAGLSQSQLAQLTGIPLRTLQQYEQRQKDINKAQGTYLLALTKILCCSLEDLMEFGR